MTPHPFPRTASSPYSDNGMKRTLFQIFLLLVPACLLAQEDPQPAASSDAASDVLIPANFTRSGTTISLGLISTSFDSYLSPNNYIGFDLDLLGEDWRRSVWGDNLFRQSIYETTVGLTMAGSTSSTLVANETYTHAYAWRVVRFGPFDLYAGPELQARVGALYNTRNSNNPVNLKLGLHAGGMAMAEVRYNIGGLPARTSYQLDLPLLGAVFSPPYTQSYYAMFDLRQLGGTVHFVSPFNGFSLRRILTTDLTLRHSILRVVLENDSYQYRTSTNSYAQRTFRLGVGFVFNSYAIRPREKAFDYLPY